MTTGGLEGQVSQAFKVFKDGVDQLGGLVELTRILAIVRPVDDSPAALVQAAAEITHQLIRRGRNERGLQFYFETVQKTGLDLLLDLQAELLQAAAEKLTMDPMAEGEAHEQRE